jgi:hypothetical protein
MGVQRKTRKFAQQKRVIKAHDKRLVKAQDQKKPNTKTGEEVRDVYVELITNIHRRIF